MTEFEKMRSGLLYNCLDPEVSAGYWRALALCERLRATRDKTEQDKILCELVPALPATASIETPFFCDTGTGIELEANVREREVYFPAGADWTAEDGTVYHGGTTATVPAPIERIPVFRRK